MATDCADAVGSVAADVTVTDDISVAQASDVLGTTYDVLDDAATVASALTAGNAEVNGAASITTNGGAVDLSFADADSLLNATGLHRCSLDRSRPT